VVDFCGRLGEKPQEYPDISRFFDNDRRKKMSQEKASYLEYATLGCSVPCCSPSYIERFIKPMLGNIT